MRFIALALALAAFELYAQTPPPSPLPPIQLQTPLFPPIALPAASPSPTLEEYEKKLEELSFASKRLSKDTWKDLVMLHKVTKKGKTFDELSTLEQNVFILMSAADVTSEFAEIDDAWEAEIKKFDNPDYKLIPLEKIENKKQNPAAKGDVENYRRQLKDMQKKFAKEHEAFAEKFVNSHKKELNEKEREFLVSEIKRHHDKLGLIERKNK